MKFKELVDRLDPKSNKAEKMTLDKFMGLLSPSERKELKKAERERRKKIDSRSKKQKD